ncbi:MAG: carboxypeptidase regulatory-like domain-containing protein [Gemmatimonadaceae bacterium]|nr:carboxypeptidase regulatory-like domain-containing protein [Gemmatimonadaceae bacterium]
MARNRLQRLSRFVAVAAGVAYATLANTSLDAQQLRGTVVQADGATPVGGVIVVIEGSAGERAYRALTDERGVFVLSLSRAGQYSGRALRIGYQPTPIAPFIVSVQGVTPLRVTLNSASVVLPTVAVQGTDVCRGQGNDGQMVAQVWEEARKALLASGLTAQTSPLMAEWVEYERTLDVNARFVRAQRARATRSATTHAFRSIAPEQLAEHGYVIDTEDGTVFHAPDADVLLSDSFAASHCFRLEPSTIDREHLVGVAFRPAAERRRVSDIEGTFWIDRATSELRTLEYRYTNLPSVTERVRPGGRVDFLRLTTGSWLVNKWFIRMPQLIITAPTTIRRRGVSVTSTPTSVTAVRLVGGEVSRVEHADSVVYRSDGLALDVNVVSSDTLHRATDTRVTMDGTDYEMLTDRLGSGRITPILPGEYRLRALSPLMDSLGIPPEPVDVRIADDRARSATIALPSALALLKRVCGENATGEQGAHVRGVVVDSLGEPLADAVVRLTWQAEVSVVKDRLLWSDRDAVTRSDSLGVWQFCDVPREQRVAVRVEADMREGRTSIQLPPDVLFASARVVALVSPRVAFGSTGERAPDSIARDAPAPPRARAEPDLRATLLISITDSSARPLRDVMVTLTATDKRTQRVRTDSAGQARLVRLPAGPVAIELRKVGYASGTVSTDLETGDNTMPITLRASSVPQLATVRVIGNRSVNVRHREFEQRLANGGATASITQEDIAKRNPASTWQMLTRVPSLLLLDSAGGVFAKSSRMSTVLCWPRLAIDGMVIPGRPNLSNLPPPSEIFGIEVFAGPARTPLAMGGEGDERYCGLIAIWTK